MTVLVDIDIIKIDMYNRCVNRSVKFVREDV